jgi:hypothetical protein
MSKLVSDCPRCRTKRITFDLLQQNHTKTKYGWQNWFEAFCVCNHCQKSTVFILSQSSTSDYGLHGTLMTIPGTVNSMFEVEGFVGLKDLAACNPPEHLPEPIEAAFREGASCMAIGCFNAGATMFRLCLDLATKGLLPPEEPATAGLNNHTRKNLGPRLEWIFNNNRLPESLKDLSSCIKDDGNDGAHDGTLSKHDSEDIQDFAVALLERLYTEPKRVLLAKERREQRRQR